MNVEVIRCVSFVPQLRARFSRAVYGKVNSGVIKLTKQHGLLDIVKRIFFITDHNASEIISIVDRSYFIQAGTVMLSGTMKDLLQNETVVYEKIKTMWPARLENSLDCTYD